MFLPPQAAFSEQVWVFEPDQIFFPDPMTKREKKNQEIWAMRDYFSL